MQVNTAMPLMAEDVELSVSVPAPQARPQLKVLAHRLPELLPKEKLCCLLATD